MNIKAWKFLLTTAVCAFSLTGCGMEPIAPDPTDFTTTASATSLQTTAATAAQTTAALPVTSDTTSSTFSTTMTTQTTLSTTVSTVPTTASTAATTKTTKQYDTGEGVTRTEKGIMIVNSGTDHPRALEIYQGNYALGNRFANAVNKWKKAMGSSVKVWCMVPPTSFSFYKPADYPDTGGSQLENFENIRDHLEDVTAVPIWYTLNAHKDEHIYSLTDYHWQPLGAYYAAGQFASLADVPFAQLDTYTSVTREGYVGAFHWVNKVQEIRETGETFTYFKPDNLDQVTATYFNTSYKNGKTGTLIKEDFGINSSYQMFGGADNLILQVDTNVNNGRTLVIFKDSFGNALVPFLTHSFQKIVLCDFRFFDIDPIKMIKDVGATDMLFCINNSTLNSSKKIQQINDLVK